RAHVPHLPVGASRRAARRGSRSAQRGPPRLRSAPRSRSDAPRVDRALLASAPNTRDLVPLAVARVQVAHRARARDQTRGTKTRRRSDRENRPFTWGRIWLKRGSPLPIDRESLEAAQAAAAQNIPLAGRQAAVRGARVREQRGGRIGGEERQ